MRSVLLPLLLGCALPAIGCGGAPPPPASGAAPPAMSAREAYDEAVIAALDGDAILWRERLVRVATDHPDSPYARAAVAQLGSPGGLALMALFGAVPFFWLRSVDASEGPTEAPSDIAPIPPEETL